MTKITEDARWQALITRDTSHLAYYAVTSTGIVCRIGCASRQPKPEHVVFFDDIEAAFAAGFRACKRCQPDFATVTAPKNHLDAQIERACERMSLELPAPGLAELAQEAGLSPGHFQKTFKATLGVTPKQYAKNAQERRFKAALTQAPSVTHALYEAGLSSSSRAYELARQRLGMEPRVWRAGAKGELLIYTMAQTELGWLGLLCSQRGICAIELADQSENIPAQFQLRFPEAQVLLAETELTELLGQVIAQIERPQASHQLPLEIQGTAFQEQVWQALLQIPAGETLSYADLAHKIGKPDAVRAVAGACAANRHAVVIPCHRIVRKDGQLSGYRWGVARKRQLLTQEGHDLSAR